VNIFQATHNPLAHVQLPHEAQNRLREAEVADNQVGGNGFSMLQTNACGPVATDKNFINFGLIGQSDIIPLADCNPFLTLATGGYRPGWSACASSKMTSGRNASVS
jgi:hypothetical protein